MGTPGRAPGGRSWVGRSCIGRSGVAARSCMVRSAGGAVRGYEGPALGGSGWRGPDRTWPGRGLAEGIGRAAGGIGRPGTLGLNAAGEAGVAAGAAGGGGGGVAGRTPTGGCIGLPRPSNGGRNGMALRLCSSSSLSFCCDSAATPAPSAVFASTVGVAAGACVVAWVTTASGIGAAIGSAWRANSRSAAASSRSSSPSSLGLFRA